jgi:spectinomycin phosphotransferase
MLEKPDISEQLIASRLWDEYGLHTAQLTFLPLGADVNTAVYRLEAEEETAYFLKLRKGAFNEITVTLPRFLKAQGMQHIIAPLETKNQQLWGSLEAYKMILYPFVQGEDGYQVRLSDQQWIELGAALKRLHTVQVPPAFRLLIRREDYSPHWRNLVKAFQAQAEQVTFDDPTAVKLAAFMQARQVEINHMVQRAESLSLALQARSLEFVLCHSDIHPGNLLISADDAFYIVDWDDPILAPKERDLMFFGAGMGKDVPGGREEMLFFEGYGQAAVDRMALVYYRYERIIQDIAEFCKLLFLSVEGGEDREQSYEYFTGQFLPDHEVESAYKTDAMFLDQHSAPN